MSRTTYIRDLQVKVSTNTVMESLSGSNDELFLNVQFSRIESQQGKCDKALAKTPEGGIVEIAFTSSPETSSAPIHIIYYL